MTKAHAVPAVPAAAATSFVVIDDEFRSRHSEALARFEQAIQSFLDTPLDTQRVLEWTRLRSAPSPV
ncbi:MAG: hypothetical protein M3273_07245 [Actinomycetota bacterium]|nr:hypothetical protein [Actinomycetota bacterium]